MAEQAVSSRVEAEVQATQTTRHADKPLLAAQAALPSHGRPSGHYISVSEACKRWPALSPRSAVLKEETIQTLAVLPDGMLFKSECSAWETHRFLSDM